MEKHTLNTLASYIDALHPIIYINHFDFRLIDEAIAAVGENVKCFEFNYSLGMVDFETKNTVKECGLEEFLKLVENEGFKQETYIILKDVHNDLCSPNVISLLKKIAENNLYNDDFYASVFILSEIKTIPRELENYITIFDIPLPSENEIYSIVKAFAADMDVNADEDLIKELADSFVGLNEYQINQILNTAYQNGGCIDEKDKRLVLKQKQMIVKKSGLLETIDFDETTDCIGGLENLKNWLNKKARLFNDLDKAIQFGVDMPKGVMLIGVTGCGKGLSAKAAANLFGMPVFRLDVGRLLGRCTAESEENLSKALKLAEAVSPCVLWIDKIERAFEGIGSQSEEGIVSSRLFKHFMTWLQEKQNTVFVVVTSDDISNIPTEFLRKGTFDELFFVDLPNGEERREILKIHLKKHGKWHKKIDSIALIKATEGYNGADLAAVVKYAVEAAFFSGKERITTYDLLKAVKAVKPVSITLKDKIDKIRASAANLDIKPANKKEELSAVYDEDELSSGGSGYGMGLI